MNQLAREISRRAFLGRGGAGLGLVALNSLLHPRLAAAASAMDPQSKGVINPLHFTPKAKRVIYLYQAGGPSHLETFDYKPKLADMTGKPMPESFTRGQQIAQLQGQRLTCLGPTHGFKQVVGLRAQTVQHPRADARTARDDRPAVHERVRGDRQPAGLCRARV